ncbi:DUF433 domain-containing protein [Tardiphaga sp.]|uniref:DUF433 domain-containing protein n=1 Tax=Tardiphaga sp. TaxID=1926292 RepID=UPI0025E35C88|nr:DUF433 domain-containing protein [Tardiphaga sp.]
MALREAGKTRNLAILVRSAILGGHRRGIMAELTERAMTSVVVRNPEVLGGRPVFRGTRVPVEVLFENLEHGMSIDEIIESYPGLCREDVIACLEEASGSLKAAAL